MQHNFQSYVAEIEKTHSVIEPHIKNTPLLNSKELDTKLGMQVFCKAENFQVTGSFKIRGALSAISRLNDEQLKKGVLAYSSGNHAQAVAFSASQNNLSAKIIMPKTAPQIKIENTKKYGAEVILYDTYFQSREEIGNEIQKKDNRALIKPYDDEDIIAGQGTAAIEIVNDLKERSIEPDLYLCCCGGGGLIAGTSTYLKHIYPNIRSYSVEPDEFDDTKRSLEAGKLIENKKNAKSFCDALLAPQPGNITFQINSNNLEGGLSVSDEEVTKTIILLAEQLKIVVEPGGAVAAAAVLNNKIDVKNKKIIVMISGGNIDLSLFNKL